jgi:hypothetical protein
VIVTIFHSALAQTLGAFLKSMNLSSSDDIEIACPTLVCKE